MRTEVVAVVAGEEEEGVIEFIEPAQTIDERSDHVVHRHQGTEARAMIQDVEYLELEGQGRDTLTQPRRLVRDVHFVVARPGGDRRLGVRIFGVARGGTQGPMSGRGREEEQEWAIVVGFCGVQEVQSALREHIRLVVLYLVAVGDPHSIVADLVVVGAIRVLRQREPLIPSRWHVRGV